MYDFSREIRDSVALVFATYTEKWCWCGKKAPSTWISARWSDKTRGERLKFGMTCHDGWCLELSTWNALESPGKRFSARDCLIKLTKRHVNRGLSCLLSDVRSPSLKVDSTMPWFGMLDYMSREKQLSGKQAYICLCSSLRVWQAASRSGLDCPHNDGL